MRAINTPQGRATRAARKPARRAHPVSRRTATQPRSLRTRVAVAFRQMAHGAQDKSAYSSTMAFYRATGHGWTKQLD